eukprot:333324-Amphidinium_carterae.1
MSKFALCAILDSETPSLLAMEDSTVFGALLAKWRLVVEGAEERIPLQIVLAKARLVTAACLTLASKAKPGLAATSPADGSGTQDKVELAQTKGSRVARWFSNHEKLTGGAPLEEFEPMQELISVMAARVCEHGLEPYGDCPPGALWPSHVEARTLSQLAATGKRVL